MVIYDEFIRVIIGLFCSSVLNIKRNCEYSHVNIHNKIHKTTCKFFLIPAFLGPFSSSKDKTKFLKMCTDI